MSQGVADAMPIASIHGVMAAAFLAGLWWLAIGQRAIQGTSPEDPSPAWRFDLLLIAAVVAGRFHTFYLPIALGVDEAQMVAQAWRCLWVDAVPWRGFDGNSGGPFNTYALVPAAWLGLPVGYATARLTAAVLWCLTLVASHRTLLRLVAAPWARVALLPVAAFLAMARESEFVHYTSEALPVALLSVAVWAAVRGVRAAEGSKGSWGWSGLAGACLGSVPYAKHQLAPLGLVLGLGGLGWLCRRALRSDADDGEGEGEGEGEGDRGLRRWSRPLALAAGALAPAAVVSTVLLTTGTWHEFMVSYITWSLEYRAVSVPWLRVVEMLGRPHSFAGLNVHVALLVASLGVVYLGQREETGASGGHGTRTVRQILPAVVVVLGFALWTVRAPNRLFDHYLLILLVPLAWTLALGLHLFLELPRDRSQRTAGARRVRRLLATATALGLLVQCTRAPRPGARVDDMLAIRAANPGHQTSVVSILQLLSRPGERLLVWGWQPSLYVESGLVPATRDAIIYNQIAPIASRDHFRQRLLADLDRVDDGVPPLVVDAVGYGSFRFTDRSDGLHSFPELAALVAREYLPLASWLGAPIPSSSDLAPIYVHRARAAELDAGAFGPPDVLRRRVLEIVDIEPPPRPIAR